MTFDELRKNWQSQQTGHKLSIDPELLLKEIKRNKKSFESAIFWRDVREVGCAVLCFVVFLFFGIKFNLWPMWLLAIIYISFGVFMVVDRMVQTRSQPRLSDALFNCVKSSLDQVNHQIGLLRNVLWWYLLPLGTGLIIWFVYRGSLLDIVVVVFLCWGVYWLNQRAVRKDLLPRKKELEHLQHDLENTDM